MAKNKNGETLRVIVMTAVAVVFALVLPLTAEGATPQKYDYVDLGLSTGYSTLVGRCKGMDVYGGAGAGLHIGYEYRDWNFWMGVRGEMQYVSSNCRSDVEVEEVRFRDTEGEQGIMHYEMTSKLREMQNFGIGGICVMAGYCKETRNKKRGFYVGAGVKVGAKFDFSNRARQEYRTYATYEEFIDPYHDMPDHYYTNHETNDTVSFGTKVNVSVVGELGWDFQMSRCDRVKVGLFAETGLTNIMRDIPVRQAWVDPGNVSVVKSYSVYNREEMRNKYIVPMVFGVKVSLLFNVSRIGDKCRTCPCYRKN